MLSTFRSKSMSSINFGINRILKRTGEYVMEYALYLFMQYENENSKDRAVLLRTYSCMFKPQQRAKTLITHTYGSL